MAIILAVDSSNNRTSLALIRDSEVLHHACCTVRDNLGWLRREVGIALQHAALRLEAIDALAVAQGPGGLTGVRVGVGFVQALGLGAGIPVVGINTLSAMALQLHKRLQDAPAPASISVALDARMGQLYVARWQGAITPAALLPAEDRVIAAAEEGQQYPAGVAAGPGWEVYAKDLPADCELVTGVAPDALEVAQLACLAEPGPAEALQVHYLRREVAQVPERLRQPVG